MRSARPSPSSGFTRTAAAAPASRQSPKAFAAAERARGRSAGGVKSSSSRMMTSAPERAAARCAASSAPGTKSQLRRRIRRLLDLAVLRVEALGLALELVERVDVGLGGGDDDVGVGADAVHDAPALGEAHGDLALRFRAHGDGVHRVEEQLRPALRDALDRLEGGIDRPVALGVGLALAALLLEDDRRMRALAHAARLAHG